MTSYVPTAKGIALILDIIEDAVKMAGPQGVPGGTLYASLMNYGCSLSLYENFMATLVNEGKLVKRGQLYIAKEHVQ